ncbi:MAG: ribosome silencing factor [Syntrophales bacterium]
MSEKQKSDSQERLLLFINALLEKKALNPVVLNVKEISAFADWFIICSGASDRQVRAIASAIQENVKKIGLLPLGVEGEPEGKWVLLDYDDVIVHVFIESIRTFYDLERLWAEAPRMAIPENATSLSSLPKEI